MQKYREIVCTEVKEYHEKCQLKQDRRRLEVVAKLHDEIHKINPNLKEGKTIESD